MSINLVYIAQVVFFAQWFVAHDAAQQLNALGMLALCIILNRRGIL